MAKGITGFLEVIGRKVGVVVSALYQAGRDSIDQIIKNILKVINLFSLLCTNIICNIL